MTTNSPTSFRLPADVDARLARVAERLGVSKSELVRETVMAELDQIEWEAAIRERSAQVRASLDSLPTLAQVADESGVALGEPDLSLLDDVQ